MFQGHNGADVMGKRWYQKDKFEEDNKLFFYIGTRKTKAGAQKLVVRERKKAGKTKLCYRMKKKGRKIRVYVGRRDPW